MSGGIGVLMTCFCPVMNLSFEDLRNKQKSLHKIRFLNVSITLGVVMDKYFQPF